MFKFRSFTVRRDGKSVRFYTLDGWRGLWSPLSIIGDQYESDSQLPGFTQTIGTLQVVGESAVRRAAREVVELYA